MEFFTTRRNRRGPPIEDVTPQTNSETRPQLIIGAGAIGLSLAALLAQGDHSSDINIVGRSNQTSKIRISLEGSKSFTSQPIAYSVWNKTLKLPDCADIWLCMKAYDLDTTLEILTDKLTYSHTLILAMNGLGIAMQASLAVKRTIPTVRALFSYGARRTSEHSVCLSGEPQALLATYPDFNQHLSSIEYSLQKSGFQTSRAKDIATAEWQKAITNIVVNGLATLARKNNSVLLTDDVFQQQAKQLFLEAKTVAAAEGFLFPELTIERFLIALENHRDNRNSTLIDIEQKKQTELPYILGRFLEIARTYDVKTPVAEKLARDLYSL